MQARQEMARSEQIAAAVALREAGLDVDATPRGALVEAVAIDVPAAKTLRGRRRDRRGRRDSGSGRPATCVEAIGKVEPGDPVAAAASS